MERTEGDRPELVLLTIDECAMRLSIGRTLTRELIASGQLKSVKLGLRARRVPAAELDAFVRRLSEEQCHESLRGDHESAPGGQAPD